MVPEQSSSLPVVAIAAGGLGCIVVVLVVVVAILVMKLKHSKGRLSSYTIGLHGSHATHVTNDVETEPYYDSISLHEIDTLHETEFKVSTDGANTDEVAVSTNPAYGVGTDGVAVTNPAYGVSTDGVEVSTNAAYGVNTDEAALSTKPANGAIDQANYHEYDYIV